MSAAAARKTIVIGVGGATSSGKTTLAKHLLALLPKDKSAMLHQDDFALPEEQLPWNETLQARDWDSPIGTVSISKA
jgi:nicotinamide/nicotinate riboside kinase